MQMNQKSKVVERKTGAEAMDIVVATQVKPVGKHGGGVQEMGKLPDSGGTSMETKLEEGNCGAFHLKNLKEEVVPQKVHSVGRWKRVRRDEGGVSDSLGKENNVGKRNSADQESYQQGASKKVKESLPIVEGAGFQEDEADRKNVYGVETVFNSGNLVVVDTNESDGRGNRLGMEIPTTGRQERTVEVGVFPFRGNLDVDRGQVSSVQIENE
ncbi:hypothetical protein LWI29_037763 [Acer saccharum]|uniref:Uncharacterized protein n=1 Tax=Acer saccharum TaxID=4024 RepID=A0AA39VUV0_ACESA|nr:hypothetical protein LWI29_037763 [Acer saccharum]